jgi:ubiquitin carboxyl-terminal hydrolase 25/28
MSQLFSNAKEALEDLEDTTADDQMQTESQLSSELDLLSEKANAELQAIDREAQDIQKMISNQFVEYQNLPYRLYAVFVHHGSVSFGHYWIYIHDFRKDIWRKYNDEYVTEVKNLDEIFRNTGSSNPPTPYFLVYINERMKDRLVDPVCRDIVQPMPDAPIAEDPSEAPAAMEDVQTTQPASEDVNMEPPSYDEAADAGKDVPQTSVDEKSLESPGKLNPNEFVQ